MTIAAVVLLNVGLATGVFVANLLQLPGHYPGLQFAIEQPARGAAGHGGAAASRDTGT